MFKWISEDWPNRMSWISAAGFLMAYFIFIALTNNEPEPVKDKRQQIVTIKNNGQEIVYYVDNVNVKLGYEDKE